MNDVLYKDLPYDVLGDLAETGTNEWSALASVLGLVVRQQMELWRAWQPWVASSLSLAGSLLLLGVSFGLSMDSSHLLRGEREYGSVLCEALLMLLWAWTSGFVVGSLSGKTRWVSGILCAMPCPIRRVRFHAHCRARVSELKKWTRYDRDQRLHCGGHPRIVLLVRCRRVGHGPAVTGRVLARDER